MIGTLSEALEQLVLEGRFVWNAAKLVDRVPPFDANTRH